AGGGQHIHPVHPAPHIGPAGHGFLVIFKHRLHDIVGVVVVVAVFGAVLLYQLEHSGLAHKVVEHGVGQLRQREVILVEHLILDGGQAVGHGADAHALNVAGVVPCAAGVVVHALGNTVVGNHRQEG